MISSPSLKSPASSSTLKMRISAPEVGLEGKRIRKMVEDQNIVIDGFDG